MQDRASQRSRTLVRRESGALAQKYERDPPPRHGVRYNALNFAPAGWKMLWLGYCYEFPAVQEKYVKGRKGLVYLPSTSPKCLHGYTSTREASEKLVRDIVPINTAVDNKIAIRPRCHAAAMRASCVARARSSFAGAYLHTTHSGSRSLPFL